MDIDVPPTAGPSRPSSRPQSPRAPLDADVEMEEQQALSRSLQALADADNEMVLGPGSQSQEAAELLLGFSSIEPRHDDIPTLDPPSPSIPHTGIEPPRLLDHATSENSYPYTPPDLPRENGDTPLITTSHPYTSSHPHLQPILPSSPAPPTSPEAGPSKPKQQKRKRTAAGSSSRRTSTDPTRPPHFMGEDNEIIRCICGIDEDDGLTIQCEACYAWQHGQCFGYSDAESAPEIYYCELCSPRPYDPGRAREIQIDARDRRRERERGEAQNLALGISGPTNLPVIPIPLVGATTVGSEKPKSRAKGKRARVGSVIEGEDRGEKDMSPGTMAPPTVKPRRKPGPKPKPKPSASSLLESTPAPTYQPPPPTTSFFTATTDADDEYFRIDPWTLEYTPVRDNVVRGRETRRIMGKMYREWVDAEEDEEMLSANKRRAVAGPSGLPSPTETGLLRFTPDNLFPSPDFSSLAPPVPPATLLGSDLSSMGHSTYVQSISQALSFLPLSYSDATPLAGPFTGPASYGVFATHAIPASSFIGEFRAEIMDCDTYRKDPVNQYDILGITKPHVHPIGPPVNLMLDARGYGCELRFIRPGCRPNVVLRPLLFRTSEVDAPKLRFGVFASGEIEKDAELVLGWAWDDSHIVHALRSLIHPTTLADGYPGRPLFAPSLPSSSPVIQSMLDKFEVVLTHLLGTFSSCACSSLGNCAVAQMRYLVEQRDGLQTRAGRRGVSADLGGLIGAVRGWRRREEEVEGMRKWNLPQEIEGPVWDRADEREDVAGVMEESRDNKLKLIRRENEEDQSASEDHSDLEEDGGMDVDEQDDEEGEDEDEDDRSQAASARSSLTPPPPRPESPSTYADFPRRQTTPPPRARSRSPRPTGIAPSSALSSAPRTQPRNQYAAPASDDGQLSDATTATIPRSPSDDEDEDDESDIEAESRARPNGNSVRARRVLSPVVEQNLPSPKAERVHKARRIRKDGKEDKRFKSRDTKVPSAAAGSNKRGRNRIVSSPASEAEDESLDLPGRRRTADGTASALFPEENEDVKMEDGDAGLDEQVQTEEKEVHVDRIPTPPLPTPTVREPTPPPPEPPKKVSISDYLKNRKIQKKSTTDVGSAPTPNGDTPSADASGALPESQSSASMSSMADVKSDVPGFNMFDFLPSSRPTPVAPSSAQPTATHGTSQTSESPRAAPTPIPSTSYLPRAEYFPITSASPAPAPAPPAPVSTPSFQPRTQSSYTPRPSVYTDSETAPPPSVPAYTPRRQSTPMEDQPPTPQPVVEDLPNGRDYGLSRSGASSSAPSRSVSNPSVGQDAHLPTASTTDFSRRRSASESPEKPSIALPDQYASMPPPLPYREPPPHQSHFRQFNSASLSPETRTSGLPPYRSPIDRTSPLPRLPPTGPKAAQTPVQSVIVPPTGPRGSWQTPTSATSVSTPTSGGSAAVTGQSTGTPLTPLVAAVPPSGPRGPMGHIPVPGLNGRGGGVGFGGNMRFFEARGAWRGRGMGRGHHIPHGARGR